MGSSHILSAYEAGGPHQLSTKCQKFTIVIGLFAYVPDSVLAYTLNENRFATKLCRPGTIVGWRAVLAGGASQTCLSSASQAGVQLLWTKIRDSVLRGALIAQAYLDEKLFAGLRQLPWTLCLNPAESLNGLVQQGQAPQEPIASKVWSLLEVG